MNTQALVKLARWRTTGARTVVYLARHGQTAMNESDSPLGALDLTAPPAFLTPPELPAPKLAWGTW